MQYVVVAQFLAVLGIMVVEAINSLVVERHGKK